MAGTLRRRGVAVTAFALASGTSLAAFGTAAPAGAATSHAPAYYQGVTSANVLSVALHLPSALPALPGIPKDLAVNLVGVTGNAVHNSLGTGQRTSSTSVSSVASGSLVKALPTDLGLGKVLTAHLGQNLKDSALPAIEADPLVNLHVGDLTAKALSGANSSTSVLAKGKVAELGQLLDLKALGKNVTLIDQLSSQVDGVSSQVMNQVNSALSTVKQLLNQTPAGSQASQTLDAVEAALQQIQAKVKAILANVGSTAVLSLDTLDAQQSIAPAGNAAKSAAAVNLTSLDLLNGLITVKGFVSQATAVANGKAGGASASFSGHAPIVAVGTPLLTATLDETGLNLSDVQGLPQDVTDQVNSALAQLQAALNTLLNTLGVHLNFVKGHVDKVDPAGRYAAATGPEYDIVLDSPIPGDGALAEIGLGHGTTASVSAQQAPKHVNLPNPQQGALPHTGGNLPLIGGVAMALLIGAAVLRRRFA
jgi:enamine deaminase RidA (YjgF/YER057c/UK114 family)